MLLKKVLSISILWLFLLCSGCGFHLRGSAAIPDYLHRIAIISDEPYNPFVLRLRQILTSANVQVLSSSAKAPLTLDILSTVFNNQLINISANTHVRTYNLQYLVTYQLRDQTGKVFYGPRTLKTSSSFILSENQILGDSDQLEQQKQRMIPLAIEMLLNQLNSNEVRHAVAMN